MIITDMVRKSTLMEKITVFRIFIIAAMLISGVVELSTSELFATPIEQIGVGAAAGLMAAIVAKVVHIV